MLIDGKVCMQSNKKDLGEHREEKMRNTIKNFEKRISKKKKKERTKTRKKQTGEEWLDRRKCEKEE